MATVRHTLTTDGRTSATARAVLGDPCTHVSPGYPMNDPLAYTHVLYAGLDPVVMVMRARLARRAVFTVVGAILCLVGAALLVLPGPGLLLVLAGLLILAQEYEWTHQFVEPVRVRAMQAAEASVSSPWRAAGSILAGLGLIGAGVVWMVLPRLPFGGVGTGTSLIISGLILLALLVYSARRVRMQATASRDRQPPSPDAA